MTGDLFAQNSAGDFLSRAISPQRELGAYEALWMKDGSWFDSLAEIFRTHPESLPSDFVSPADIEKYSRLARSAIAAAGIKHYGVRIHGAGEYPQKLRDAVHRIELLYFQGLWDLVSTRCLAIVGTREPSDEGRARAATLAKLCVADGFTVVSGLAAGIDTIAHTAAISAGGHTIAVLGTPITDSYPPENRALQARIAAGHLIVSQVPILHYADQHFHGDRRKFFPERNATTSALTEATIIVEAGNTSGTLIQARHALKQGRKLFILDNCFRNPSLTWAPKFVAQGAIRVRDFADIKSHLAATHPQPPVEN